VLVANAGVSVTDTRAASADGYEMTFAINYLAHAQLIGDLLDSFTAPARIVLLGSNTYRSNWARPSPSVTIALTSQAVRDHTRVLPGQTKMARSGLEPGTPRFPGAG
jgi:NAD(P)-dependent dehydrogenase (short-subunit alcohol dehydrogenase family)